MLGPLPMFYRVAVSICALCAFVGLGIWGAAKLSVAFLPLAGAGVGAALGVIAVLVLLHDFDGARSRAPVRDDRPR